MIEQQTPLEIIRPPAGKCHGAVFCSYAFDESFFNTVLTALLPIHGDAESDSRFFLMEARRRLRETPVVVLADGRSYAGGHQLPFDLVLSDRTTAFHARLALLLFERHARLVVGSANLTPVGFGDSADLSAVLHLDYAKDANLLRNVTAILVSAGVRGEGWDRFCRQCRAMCKPGGKEAPFPRLLATKEDATVLEQFLAGIPKSARADQVHVMAPTQPEDDARSGARALVPLHAWIKARAKTATLNLAVAWADSSVVPPPTRQITEPEQLAGYLCAEMQGAPGAETVGWHAIDRIEGSKLYVENRTTPLMRKAVATVMQAEPPRAWAVEEVTGVGLLEALEPFSEASEPTWWLFPEVQLRQGRVRRRPFHAKMIGVCTVEKGKPFTHVLLGSPNFERKLSKDEALFEIGIHLRLDGHASITDLCPELVPAPSEGMYLEDRSWLPANPRIRPPLEQATYDAQSHQLKLEWRHRAPECLLTYQREGGEEQLLKGRPGLHTSLPGFILAHGSSELRLEWGDDQALVPITVCHAPFLRADEPERQLTLGEFVALYGSQQRVVRTDRHLSAQDVFEAQSALVERLSNSGMLLGAFDVAMHGPVGLRAYAACLLQTRECDAAEAWLYGLELAKLLRNLDWRGDPFQKHKKGAVDEFVAELTSRLTALAPDEPWSGDVAKSLGAGG